MARHRGNEPVAGLDMGSSHVRCVVGELDEKGIQITGIGEAESLGLKGGVVMNIESTTRAIRKAVDDAARMAGCEIGRVFVNVGGPHLEGTNSNGVVAIRDGEVCQDDCDRVLDAAKAIKLTPDREFLQMLPQMYLVDETDNVRSPIGITGVRLEARVHVVTAARSSVQNLRRCVHNADLDIAGMVASPLAGSYAALYDDEKELGVAMVDVGAGTTDIAIWHEDALVHTAVLPFGGSHITNDVAHGLPTQRSEAERIKVAYGCATAAQVDDDELIEVRSVGNRPPQEQSRQFLAELIEPRVAEILEHVRDEIRRTGYDQFLAAGMVLTGGTANLQHVVDIAQEIVGMPVRIGRSEQVCGLKEMVANPAYSTAVGLVAHGFRCTDNVVDMESRRRAGASKGLLSRTVEAVRKVGALLF